MPIYVFRARDRSVSCEQCRDGFEQTLRIADSSLEACPRCGAAIEQVITAPNIGSGGAHRLSESHIEKHGFTQYKKIGKGVYEKTAGKGPNHISDD